jgi:hypothetical protein
LGGVAVTAVGVYATAVCIDETVGIETYDCVKGGSFVVGAGIAGIGSGARLIDQGVDE